MLKKEKVCYSGVTTPGFDNVLPAGCDCPSHRIGQKM